MLGDLHPKRAGIITQTGIHSGAFGIKDLPETLHQPIAAAHLLQSLAPGIDEGIQAPQRIVSLIFNAAKGAVSALPRSGAVSAHAEAASAHQGAA